MDRLHALGRTAVLALCVGLMSPGCDEAGGGAVAAAPVSRVQAVAAKAPAADELTEFCDVRAEPGAGALLALPALEPAAPPTERTSGAQWLNVWATWCKPCVEELPMIARFEQRLASSGTALSLHLVSVDDSLETISAFRSQHSNIPESMRLTDPAALALFVQSLGLDSGAGLPIHAFTGPDGKLRCVRAGAVLESHYDTVARLLR